MTTGPPRHYDVTPEALIRALVTHPLTEQLTPQARERMAGRLLAQMPVVPDGQVTVSVQDLVAVLGEAEPFIGGKDNAAFTRLAEAAGVA